MDNTTVVSGPSYGEIAYSTQIYAYIEHFFPKGVGVSGQLPYPYIPTAVAYHITAVRCDVFYNTAVDTIKKTYTIYLYYKNDITG